MLERFVGSGLEVQRLGQGRIELSAGASGSLDTLSVAGVSLISAAVDFNTSLVQTAFDIAANINALTGTHGFEARAGISDTNAEVHFFQIVPGLLADSAVLHTQTTMTVDYIRPTGETDNELFGDTDDFVTLESLTLAADDFGSKWIVRVATSAQFAPTTLINKGTGGAIVDAPVIESDGVKRYRTTVIDVANVSTLPDGYTSFVSAEQQLPIKVWQKGGFEAILSCAIDAVFAPDYLLAT